VTLTEETCHCGKDGHPLHSTSCPVHEPELVEKIARVPCRGAGKPHWCGATSDDPDPCADGCRAPWKNHVHMGRDKLARQVISIVRGVQ